MSNLGSGEIFLVLLLALIVLGPERLPEVARQVGGFVRKARTMSAGIQDEVRNALEGASVPPSVSAAAEQAEDDDSSSDVAA